MVRVIKELHLKTFGNRGMRFIDSGFVAVTGESYYYFRVLSEASVTFVNAYGGDNATAKTFAVGEEFYGDFTTLTVASGEIVAYRN